MQIRVTTSTGCFQNTNGAQNYVRDMPNLNYMTLLARVFSLWFLNNRIGQYFQYSRNLCITDMNYTAVRLSPQ